MSDENNEGVVNKVKIEPAEIARRWLGDFGSAIAEGDEHLMRVLFEREGHWRDLVSLSWDLQRLSGEDIPGAFIEAAQRFGLTDLHVADDNPPPRVVVRSGREVVEVFFDFRTHVGRGTGVARLIPDEGNWVAWVVLTTLQALGHVSEGAVPSTAHRDPRERWADIRAKDIRHDHEPQVLIVGAGQGGLSLGARLKQLGVDALLVEKLPRVGDGWRNRYDSLALHTPIQSSHLPYLPFPSTFPMFLPKDKLADWFEFYAASMELNVWTGSEVHGAVYDDAQERWNVRISRPDGTVVERNPTHLVMATGGGFGSIPFIPDLPGLDLFSGEVMHSKHFINGQPYADKRVLVVGTSTSGHDVAYDLHRHGADVTMLQRGSITVVSPAMANLTVSHYFSEAPIDEADLIGASGSIEPVMAEGLRQLTESIVVEHDRELLESLDRRGLRTDQAEDGTGWLLKSLRTGGGYYINVGASDAIAAGDIAVVDLARLDTFDAASAVLDDGNSLPADLIVLSTGYLEPREDLRAILGNEIAERIGSVFRLDEQGEHANTWRPTPQRGLWIMGGGLGQARNYSRYLALQLAAAVQGLHPAYRRDGRQDAHVAAETAVAE